MPSCCAALSRVLPAITSPVRRATIGCCQPKRRSEAATWGTAASLRRGLVGEQNSREIGTISTGGGADVSKRAPLVQGCLEPLGRKLGRMARHRSVAASRVCVTRYARYGPTEDIALATRLRG